MGSRRAGAGGDTTLRDIGQRSGTAQNASGYHPGAITTRRGPRRKPRLGPAGRKATGRKATDRKARSRRRARRLLVTSAIVLTGLVAGLIGGMISGIA